MPLYINKKCEVGWAIIQYMYTAMSQLINHIASSRPYLEYYNIVNT